ncbi:bifunctional hydroxyethylthiazole kinase/thiamine-phosphate diphosphorylase [Maudiozyma barnettii]|uniref:Similar to Saccharomyces cerevisiae YPL214C THI6 Bifunctional enzyme with thiamine- phosphate pyrophosphorylase and 4-methyl-5-beta-hydroxyethylthiazole kinase activities n=1 Tax=Maudiozyma barnettii TaxID=61262 RepID=A0A8H2VHG1_9SACH|nr:bifunctional hydroxyethylthiazole kinase/thiamine-phosphate diphosphorylase [Kazachstania barnettii]CAB4255358.1 similar to Saccharomyces cerevisiae YPL214C THI6 Bifunctional enzyme with thiamine- phosphate pyrophosphorylase and 4-methyl-5-beta-hydroxyethylthiazole kinase activities [Kazachstania barnettii]
MVFAKEDVDYSLYLVTDSGMLPEGTTLCSQIEAGLQNGVTLVQIREKETDTKLFIEEALEVKKLCTKYNVPLIINDRIDVAMAIKADGVHVGQDDMPIPMVRNLVGPDMIIGWSVGKVSEVEQLAKWGPQLVDYIGIGTLFPTQTKKNAKKIPMGPQGAIEVLNALESNNATWCKTVGIGGLHPDNIQRVLYQCTSTNGKRSLDGISLVSDIMASTDAAGSTKILRALIDDGKFKFGNDLKIGSYITPDVQAIHSVLEQVSHNRPLIQHITNKVHQNFGANVTLALGSSPIMSEIESEVGELSRIPNATLLLNTGSIAPVEMVRAAIHAYNEAQRPIVFDPVGYSATTTRKSLNDSLLSYGQFTCIKGNSGEILGLSGLNNGNMKGVDADTSHNDSNLLAKATRIVAFRFKTIAVCTGEVDYICDGTFGGEFLVSQGTQGASVDSLTVYTVQNGNIPIMGDITASGCSLGSTIASLVGGLSPEGSVFDAIVSAILLYKSAGKNASLVCEGSGSFHVKLIDNLYQLFHENEPSKWSATLQKV